MTNARSRIGDLVLRVQKVFLDNPGLAMTGSQVQQRVGLDRITCCALLDALADAKVLARTGQDTYVRRGPSGVVDFSRRGARRPRRGVSPASSPISSHSGTAA